MSSHVRSPEESADPLLRRLEDRESSARTYSRRLPVALASARGCLVRDTSGREYIDCLAGAGSLALGHHHPVVVAALQDALTAEVPLTTLDMATPLRDAFTETLLDALPPGLRDGRIQFCGPTGADAVEAALKLVRTATGRAGVIAFGG
ncbi:MAG: aminotransferase class III-fold pyridoxal phosphate-dependent enzyme, partial [Thermoleophilia bacterium]